MQDFPSCTLHGFSRAQTALRNPGHLARAHVLITEHWRGQGHTRPLLRVMTTGLTFPPGPFLGRLLNIWPHTALALLTAQLFNTARGRVEEGAGWGGGAGEAVYVLPQMLPPNRTAPSTTSQALPHPIYEYRAETFRVRSEVNFLELLSQQQCQLAKRETGSGGSSRLSKILGER